LSPFCECSAAQDWPKVRAEIVFMLLGQPASQPNEKAGLTNQQASILQTLLFMSISVGCWLLAVGCLMPFAQEHRPFRRRS